MAIRSFVAALASTALLVLCSAAQAADLPAVLITGASSGIGLRTTQLLSSSGFYVYAGARKSAEMAALGVQIVAVEPGNFASKVPRHAIW